MTREMSRELATVRGRIELRLRELVPAGAPVNAWVKWATRKIGLAAMSRRLLRELPGDLADYHLDHVRPVSSYDWSRGSWHHSVVQAFAYSNLQWLRRENNWRKGKTR